MSDVEKGSVVGDRGRDAADHGLIDYEMNSWSMFASLMMFFIGLWSVFEGFVGLYRSAYFTGATVFGNVAEWSIVWIAVGAVQMTAAYAIFSGREWARWLGIVLAGSSALVHMLSIHAYPWWSLFVVTIDVAIVYALAVRWRPAVTAHG